MTGESGGSISIAASKLNIVYAAIEAKRGGIFPLRRPRDVGDEYRRQ
jgi:hypothetical protein